MKRMIYKFIGLIFLFVFLTAGCELSGTAEDLEEHEEENPVSVFPPELVQFDFYLQEGALEVGESIIIRGIATSDVNTADFEEPLDVVLSTDAGEQVTVSDLWWWDFFPSEELLEVFRNHTYFAVIFAKEADEERGFSTCAEGQEWLVSDKTTDTVMEWINKIEGVNSAHTLSPIWINILVSQKDITGEEIQEIRDHPNVWLFWPATGHWMGKATAHSTANNEEEDGCNETIREVARLFFWEELEELLNLEPGMVLTASYEQPDGSLLETSVNIVE